ncbi:MAG: acyl-CoA dehydrogenase family protein [Dehalococcoidia bacterium]
MEFRMSREQELFRRSLREYCEKNVVPRSREIDEKEAGIPDDIINGLAELGVFGCTIPEKYGGSAQPGEEMQYANIAIHELGRAELSMSLPVYTLLTIGWGGMFLSHYASEEVKQEVLPKLASGEWSWGIAVTEPGGGSDIAASKSSVVKKGDKFVINGEKAYISQVTECQQRGGGHCSLFVADPSLGNRAMTFLAVIPNQVKGITSTVYKDMGRMGLSTGGFIYKNVEIPAKYLLGEEGKGFYPCMEGFNVARVVVAAACLGGAEKCLEIAVDYAKQRKAFGQTLSKFEGISFDLVEIYTRLEMLKLNLQKVAWMIDRYYTEPGSFTQKDINIVVAQCKWLAPQLAVDAAKQAIMILGAFGYTKESPLEMALRGAMSYVAGAEGAANIMKVIIARDAFGKEFVDK